jgi:hypothetical protein
MSKVCHFINKLCNTIFNQGRPWYVLTQAGIETFLSCNTCENHRSKLGSWCHEWQTGSTTSYTCTFHLRWLLGKFPMPAQFLLAGMPWWWSSQTVSVKTCSVGKWCEQGIQLFIQLVATGLLDTWANDNVRDQSHAEKTNVIIPTLTLIKSLKPSS